MASTSRDLLDSSPHRYRAISVWALLSVVCGAASVTMFLGWMLAVLPLAAVYFGWEALCQIDRAPEEYTGVRLAKTGMGLGAALGIVLGAWLIFGKSEVPHGYQVLNWADLEPDKNGRPSAAAQKLNDDKVRVYVRGYVLSGKQWAQLNEFSICRTSDQCRFQTPAAIAKTGELIRIKLTGDRTIDFTTHEIGIGGVFHDDGLGSTPYLIEADYIYQ
jgi:hypothetical protein